MCSMSFASWVQTAIWSLAMPCGRPGDSSKLHEKLPLQVRYLDGILEWLDQQNTHEGSALHGVVDMTRIGTAGHSRGAKLACLHLAGSFSYLVFSILSVGLLHR